MKITYFYRRPQNIGHYSIEFIFDTLIKNLPSNVTGKKKVSRYFSSGILSRLRIILDSSKYKSKGSINHITGDIHFIAIGLPKKNTILTIHDIGFLNTNNTFNRVILQYFWITLPVKRVAFVTVVSEATKQELLKVVKVNPNKIRVIGNFISSIYNYQPKKFNFNYPVILQIGCAPNKNIFRLASALRCLPCKLVLIGNLNNELVQVLQENFISYQHKSNLSELELFNEYKNCDIVSFVSLLEGFGLPILEAQATGRPVITSNCSSMPEVAGEGACFVDPANVESIRQGILKVIQDTSFRASIILKGFENVKRFNIQTITKEYVSLYNEIHQQDKNN